MQAKDAHYRFSFCPAFWEFLVAGGREDKLLSIDKIRLYKEICGSQSD
jgi:hypothetical protein